ncbi:MAG TPA: hypothetical protein VMK32_06605 [Burkholderiaceae bacterium]|nr:hypothetical protein [Burkholderiaceae bacterium]
MSDFPARDLAYVIRLDEVLWGSLLLAITVAVHGLGLFSTLRVTTALKDWVEGVRLPGVRLAIIILAVWMIVVISLLEVALWAGFFSWKGAQPNVFSAFYNALLNYTTLQAGYLPMRWRLLEGMLGLAGLITFAWSTGILFGLAQELLQQATKAEQTAQADRVGPKAARLRNH